MWTREMSIKLDTLSSIVDKTITVRTRTYIKKLQIKIEIEKIWIAFLNYC